MIHRCEKCKKFVFENEFKTEKVCVRCWEIEELEKFIQIHEVRVPSNVVVINEDENFNPQPKKWQ